MRDKGAGQCDEEDKPCPVSQAWKKTELQGQREIPAFPSGQLQKVYPQSAEAASPVPACRFTGHISN